MVGWVGAPSGAPFPVNGKANPAQSIAIRLASDGDGYTTHHHRNGLMQNHAQVAPNHDSTILNLSKILAQVSRDYIELDKKIAESSCPDYIKKMDPVLDQLDKRRFSLSDAILSVPAAGPKAITAQMRIMFAYIEDTHVADVFLFHIERLEKQSEQSENEIEGACFLGVRASSFKLQEQSA